MASLVEPTGIETLPFRNEDFSRSVNAVFDTRDHAETARQDLIAAGVHVQDIALFGEPDTAVTTADDRQVGFWETLKDLFMPEEDRGPFAEAIKRGGTTVSVRTDTANHDRVIDILDRDGAVDLDEREESWRNDGWTGYTARDPLSETSTPPVALDDHDMSYAPASAATAGFGASEADQFLVGAEAAPPVRSPGALPASALIGDTEPPQMSSGDRIASVARDLSHGRSRIRSYVRDTGTPPFSGESR